MLECLSVKGKELERRLELNRSNRLGQFQPLKISNFLVFPV